MMPRPATAALLSLLLAAGGPSIAAAASYAAARASRNHAKGRRRTINAFPPPPLPGVSGAPPTPIDRRVGRAAFLSPSNPRRNHRVVAASSQGQADSSSSSSSPSSSSDRLHKIVLHLWAVGTAAFVIVNAKFHPFPAVLLHSLTRQQWALVHAVSSMLFSGTIVLSALLEQIVVASKNVPVIRFWFTGVPKRLDATVVLPSLSFAMLSGVGQAYWDYGGLMSAPKHVTGAFHCLLAFGMWWMVTDVTTQKGAAEAVETLEAAGRGEAGVGGGRNGEEAEVPRVLRRRATSNVVSCLFVVGLYALMVLKPGFGA